MIPHETADREPGVRRFDRVEPFEVFNDEHRENPVPLVVRQAPRDELVNRPNRLRANRVSLFLLLAMPCLGGLEPLVLPIPVLEMVV